MRLRFSFKALLVVFTVIAVCIGMFAVRLHAARRQRDAVAALRSANSSVWYEYETRNGGPLMNVPDPLAMTQGFGPPEADKWKVWLGRQFGRDFVFDVRHVYNGVPLSADVVARLPDLRRLQNLHLNVGEDFDDEAWLALLQCRQVETLTLERDQIGPGRRLAGLAGLDQLRNLEIHGAELTVEDTREIAQLRGLRELTFSLVSVTDDALQPFAQLKQLERFSLTHRGHGREVTAAGIAFVAQMSALRSLTLARLPTLNDDVFSHLEPLVLLESLNLDQATITGAELKRLASLPKLKELNLIGTHLDDAAMEKLEALTQLEVLDISGTSVTDAGLRHVGSLRRLRELSVNGITDESAAAIGRLTQLEELGVNDIHVSDAGLERLAKLTKLRTLWVGGNSRITPQGLAQLKSALPNCSIQ